MRSEKNTDVQLEAPAGKTGSRSFIAQARRAQIIRCAIEAIADVGYTRASLAEIARRAGISKGVICYHFSGKDELMEQVVNEIYTAGVRFMVPRLQAAKSATEMLRAYIESNIEFVGRDRKQIVALIEIFANLRGNDDRPPWDASSEEPIIASLETMLIQGQRDGEFRAFVPRIMAITIRRAIDGVAPELAADPSLDVGVYGRELATLFELATRREES